MTLRHEPDVSLADWFAIADADADWWTTVTQGPAGLDAYATVWFEYEESNPYRSDDEIMALVINIAANYTRTPDDVFFGLWDGWGELYDGARQYSSVRNNWLRDLWVNPIAPRTGPAFDDEIINGPKVNVQDHREYLLFRGASADVGNWGAHRLDVDIERALAPASITWPADRAWFVTADVDPSWLCVAGSSALIEELLDSPALDAEPAVHGQIPPLEFEDR